MSRDFKEISNILQKSVREGKNVYRLLELVSMLPWSKILKLNSKEFLHLLDTRFLTRHWASKYIKSTQE